jgi:hypothetical protein
LVSKFIYIENFWVGGNFLAATTWGEKSCKTGNMLEEEKFERIESNIQDEKNGVCKDIHTLMQLGRGGGEMKNVE